MAGVYPRGISTAERDHRYGCGAYIADRLERLLYATGVFRGRGEQSNPAGCYLQLRRGIRVAVERGVWRGRHCACAGTDLVSAGAATSYEGLHRRDREIAMSRTLSLGENGIPLPTEPVEQGDFSLWKRSRVRLGTEPLETESFFS